MMRLLKQPFKHFFALSLVAMLAGCSHSLKQEIKTDNNVTKVNWTKHADEVRAISSWQAKGRLAVAQGNKGGNASFVWQEMGDRYQIQMHGPFGAGGVMIAGGPDHVFAIEANGKKHHAKSPEALMQHLAGWHVPLRGLRHWIRGVPIPNVSIDSQRFNAEGLLESLSQEGWSIRYNEYAREKVPLPKKIQLHNPKLKIKIIITAWGE